MPSMAPILQARGPGPIIRISAATEGGNGGRASFLFGTGGNGGAGGWDENLTGTVADATAAEGGNGGRGGLLFGDGGDGGEGGSALHHFGERLRRRRRRRRRSRAPRW